MSKFEDLEVWKKSARLSAEIYKAMAELKDFGFKDQITRASGQNAYAFWPIYNHLICM